MLAGDGELVVLIRRERALVGGDADGRESCLDGAGDRLFVRAGEVVEVDGRDIAVREGLGQQRFRARRGRTAQVDPQASSTWPATPAGTVPASGVATAGYTACTSALRSTAFTIA